ncbi:MAG: iron transporter [Desulfobacteraceae bacterium]|nr:iron transporter [Desulfobacteraceae bacterium]
MSTRNKALLSRIKIGAKAGLHRGISGFFWLLKILVPISFATALLVHFELIYKLDFLLSPAMNLLMLPASAVIPLVIGLFTGIYGAVAAMAVLPLTTSQMALIAIFLLISHNIVLESIVQGQSGINPFFAAFFRIAVSFIVTFICARIMGDELLQPIVASAQTIAHDGQTFFLMLKVWIWDIFKLCVQIFFIIMPLMMVLELAKEFNTIYYITKAISPVLFMLGLNKKTGILWLTAATFGLAYGSAVLVEETKTNSFAKADITPLHLSIGINHAMIEDPALFLPLGISPVWLWIPRLVAAIAATYLFHTLNFLRRLNAKRAGHKKFCNN